MKKIFYLILTFSLFFGVSQVKAFSIDMKPRICVRDTQNSVDCSSKGEIGKLWDNNYWTTSKYLGSTGSTGPLNDLISFQWPDYNLCKGKTMLISGYIGGLFGYFDANSAYEIYNNDNQMSCSYTRIDSSRLKFTCSGIGGGDFLVNFNLNSFSSRENYKPAISQVVDISCDSSNADIITNNNNNTQNIIINNNSNTDKITDSINNTNDTMKDDNIDTSSSNSFFNNFSNNQHGLTGVINAPLSFIQSLSNSSCSSVSVTIPFVNEKFNLPCFSSFYKENFNAVYTIYQVVITALVGYWVCVKIYAMVKGFKDPTDDRIEVMDL
jgi:hypothetical protein